MLSAWSLTHLRSRVHPPPNDEGRASQGSLVLVDAQGGGGRGMAVRVEALGHPFDAVTA